VRLSSLDKPFAVSVTELANYGRILAIVSMPCKKIGHLVYSVFVTSSLASSNSKEKTEMNRFVLAIALACALSGTALAGDIHTTGEPAPGDIHTAGEPAPGDISTSGSTAPGNIPTLGNPSPGDIPSGGLSVVLTILDLLF
jgi:hypothetical protein